MTAVHREACCGHAVCIYFERAECMKRFSAADGAVAVTGATGMIGTAILTELAELQRPALAIVRPTSGRIANIPKSEYIKVVECDASGYAALEPEDCCESFIHLAWSKTSGKGRSDAYLQTENIKTTLDAVKLAERMGCSSFVGAGSQAEYGACDSPLEPYGKVSPQSGYGMAKYAASGLTGLLCGQLGIRHSWARILSVYGEHDNPSSLVMYCTERLLSGLPLELTPCVQIWDYMYCRDTARALIAIADRGRDGGKYCLGSGRCRPLSEYVQEMKKIADSSSELLFGAKPYYPDQAMYLCADIGSLVEDTGFVPNTAFSDGYAKTVEWFRHMQ